MVRLGMSSRFGSPFGLTPGQDGAEREKKTEGKGAGGLCSKLEREVWLGEVWLGYAYLYRILGFVYILIQSHLHGKLWIQPFVLRQ